MSVPDELPGRRGFWRALRDFAKTLPAILAGVAALITAIVGFIALPAETRSEASTPGTESPPPPEPAAPVTLASPGPNAPVGQCAVFSGTADLPSGRTVVLATHNLSHDDGVLYLQAVVGYDIPAALSEWTATIYFGSNRSSVGQTYEVEVLTLDLTTVATALADPANQPSWHDTALPAGAVEIDSILVTRVEGEGNCR